ncbi:MAG: hypothetical protein NVSMB62_28080 [Acidobacteriaceae bacterium]
MGKKTPTVADVSGYGKERGRRRVLSDPQQPQIDIPLDSEAWFTWLEEPTTTSFSYPLVDTGRGYIVGFMTVRKERRQRGQGYWTVFRRSAGRLRKVYVGRSQVVTDTRLRMIADTFHATEESLTPTTTT